jgi:hypothetical protein
MPILRPPAAGTRWFVSGVAAAAMLIAAPAGAQEEARHVDEASVELTQVRHLHVTSTGRIIEDAIAPNGGYAPRLCNQISTHTNASFSGGTYTLQAGFAQGELLAQTYTIPAAEFPVHILSAEAIFATSGATVATTTQWSVLFYSGLPTTGTLVEAFSSDDLILPHIHMNPGTNAVDVQFSIDPGDPDQLFISDNGTHQITVAFRIDHHNNQQGNPCNTSPGTCCNAFPVTDNTQTPPCNQYPELAQPTLNWLNGINCGSAGCPPNGGWARFSQLVGDTFIIGQCFPGCRPHGDWVMRATWSGVNCQPGVGACCSPSGTCSVIAQTDCANAGGTYQGDGSTCSGVTCPQPQGACCFPNGFCGIAGQQDCVGAGGTFAGAGTVCGSNNTCPLGGCCLADGTCIGNVTQSQCTAQGGTFRGVGTDCSTACPPPNGACCAANGFCFQTSQANCVGSGGTFYGAGVACGTGSTCPIGACCMPDGSCTPNVSAAGCANAGGTYHGNGSTCASANCPQPNGACCSSNGFCFITSSATCAGSGGTWAGPGTTCADNNGNGQPDVCEPRCDGADFNCDGDVGTDADIESFFACIGGNCPAAPCTSSADFNHDGDVGTDADIESFFRVLGGGPC